MQRRINLHPIWQHLCDYSNRFSFVYHPSGFSHQRRGPGVGGHMFSDRLSESKHLLSLQDVASAVRIDSDNKLFALGRPSASC